MKKNGGVHAGEYEHYRLLHSPLCDDERFRNRNIAEVKWLDEWTLAVTYGANPASIDINRDIHLFRLRFKTAQDIAQVLAGVLRDQMGLEGNEVGVLVSDIAVIISEYRGDIMINGWDANSNSSNPPAEQKVDRGGTSKVSQMSVPRDECENCH